MLSRQILDYFLLACTVVCLSGVCYGAVRTETCDSVVNTCTDGTTCDNGTCFCNLTTHYYMNSMCSTKLALGTECPSGYYGADGSVCADVNAECRDGGTGIECLCNNNHFNNGGTCTSSGYLSYGSTCPTAETDGPEASQYCSGTHVKCLPVSDGATTFSCQCWSGYFWNGNNCAIDNSVAVGDVCPSAETTTNTYCTDDNARCTLGAAPSYTCQCINGYFTMGSACHKDKSVSLGGTCPQVESDTNTYCRDDNSLCTGATGSASCRCKTAFFEMNSACIPNYSIQLNQECPSLESEEQSVFCRTDKSICLQSGTNTFTCQCANGYFEYGGICVQDRTVLLGGSCPSAETDSTTFCQDVNARCTLESGGPTYICQCKDTHFRDGATCLIKNSVAIGDACPVAEVSTNIYCSDTNARCTETGGTTTCQCIDSHFVFGTTCASDNSIALNGSCPGHESPDSSTEYCDDSNARCSSNGSIYTCVCMTGYFVHNSVCMKDKSLALGATCPGLEQPTSPTTYCSDTNARCSGTSSRYTCVCLSSHYDNNRAATSGGTCVTKVVLGEPCPQPDACEATDSVCNLGTCRCVTTHYDDNGLNVPGGQCTLKVALGYQCPQPEACSKSNSVCSGGFCKCSENYYDTNTENTKNGTCNIRKTLDSNCDSGPNVKQCYESTASCRLSSSSGLTTCRCDTGYYKDGQQCIPNKALGESCGECSDINAECYNDICRCKAGYYDDNGSTFSGTCKPVADLRVAGITFPGVENTQLHVSWSAPPVAASLISAYVVEWRPSENSLSVGSQHVGGGSTGITISGLTAGKAYTITVATVNSAAGYDRSTSSTKSQATRPYPPTLNLGNSNFNVQNNRIGIAWNPPTDRVSSYSVQLFDGNTLVGEAQPTVISTFLYGSNAVLKHGYNYTLKIVSRSEIYDTGKTVASDTLQEFVKTVVTVPGAPTSVQCVSREAESIMLTWTAPTLPNGDLLQYIIKVRIYSTMAIVGENPTASTITEFIVSGLTSGTSYSFDVYTQNELYNSSLPGSTLQYCSTKARRAEAPRDVSVADKTSRTVHMSWNSPAKLYGEENLGYLVIVKPTETMSCKEEVFYQCNDCVQSINKPQTTCVPSDSLVIQASAEALKDRQFNYTFEGLLPDTEYEISVAAINSIGLGDRSVRTPTTNEEEPQKPSKPILFNKQQTSFQVVWNLAEPRPGKVTYAIHVTADARAPSKAFITSGFTNTTLTVTGLEEYWGYVVQVIAASSVGTNTSDISDKITTLSAAPGPVHSFTVATVYGGDCIIQATWKIPLLLQRNSIIKQFVFKDNSSGVVFLRNIAVNPDENFLYILRLDVVAYQYYMFEDSLPLPTYPNTSGIECTMKLEVYAVNDQDESGETSTKIVQALPIAEAPQDFSVIESTITESAATLTWTSGDNRGHHVTFTIQYKQSNANVWNHIPGLSASTTTFRLDRLHVDTTYIARMTATNDVGESQPTESVAFSTKNGPDQQPLTAIIGGALGGVALVAIVCVVALLICKYRDSESNQSRRRTDRDGPTDKAMSPIDSEKRQYELTDIQTSNQGNNGSGTNDTDSSTDHYMGLSQYSNVQNTYAELDGNWS